METVETRTIVSLNPATERVGWGRGSELFACPVFNLSIYFCLALCFLQSRSHTLFKTPNILKIRFEITFLHRFPEKSFSKNFEKLQISENFREKSKMLKMFLKNRFFGLRGKIIIFNFPRKFFGNSLFFPKITKTTWFIFIWK